MHNRCGIALSFALALASSPVVAQEAEAASEEAAAFDWSIELRLRGERTVNIPGRVDDIERMRSALRAGFIYDPGNGWEFGATAKLAAGDDDNDDNRRNNDNEESNGAALDELYAAYHFSADGRLQLGKTGMPLVLSPLLWDRDLRPFGASIDYTHGVRDFDALHVTAGYFAGDHLYGDESRIAALQIGYGWMEGAETGFSTFLSYLDFDDLDVLAREGLGRTNRRIAGRLLSDYELLDLQLIGRTRVFEAPLVARLDLVRNYGADDLRDGGRFSLVWGDADRDGGWELGYAYQRAQRDAVLAAFAEDDWWFHSFAHGYMPWVAYGFGPHLSLQATAFLERRDGIEAYTERYLLDLRSRW
ncbi:MAG: hypothetical protein IT479_08285 [Xanthomonadales bacterium]|nr:hypothetical protein [Xanthomonadales bacterium]MCC6593259.1 hypothetical protein [Xanthomonadales bacterium]MCE7930931.1 hypothetical protein [Xanthomonadales bacterium PRO6]